MYSSKQKINIIMLRLGADSYRDSLHRFEMI